MRRSIILVLAGLVLFMMPSGALAHGDLQGTDPTEGAALGSVPRQVSLTLTEAPGPGSTLEVIDGCKEDVARGVAREGSDLLATVAGGEPGRWSMRYRAVSSVDGHVTKGDVRFRVRGRADCSKDEPDPDGTDTQIGGGEDTQVLNDDPPEEGGGFPVIPLAIGTVVLVGLALMLRASTKE